MADSVEALLFDMLIWLEAGPRAYGEVMDAWKTSCPRLAVWEDAVNRGVVRREGSGADGGRVALTDAGRRFVDSYRRSREGDRQR